MPGSKLEVVAVGVMVRTTVVTVSACVLVFSVLLASTLSPGLSC